jgi:hypothetical protein
MIKLSKLAQLLTTHAQPLKWALALLIINASTYSFALQHGSVKFDNQSIQIASFCLSGFVYFFVVYRLARPFGVQDLQALLILLFLPSFLLVDSTIKHALIITVLLCRWHKVSRIIGSTAAAIVGIALLYFGLPSLLYYYIYSPQNKVLFSKTDGVYYLYGYAWQNIPRTTYLLFRKVELLPGISLEKKVTDYTSDKPVTVIRTPEGKYKIVDIPSDIPSEIQK